MSSDVPVRVDVSYVYHDDTGEVDCVEVFAGYLSSSVMQVYEHNEWQMMPEDDKDDVINDMVERVAEMATSELYKRELH